MSTTTLTKESLAALLNGRGLGDEITDHEEHLAEAAGLVVVFGYSDDNCELRGAFNDELSCFGGGEFIVNKTGVVMQPTTEERKVLQRFGVLEAAIGGGKGIEAVWDEGTGYSWTYKTDIPHATFDIMEEGEKFCRGIVFSVTDLP